MARTDAQSILSAADKDKLSESYGAVIESVQKAAVSEQLKNRNYSGDATSGSVEVSRFVNAVAKDQGTARTAGEGDKLNNKGKVTINVDVDKEIVEEVAKKDVKLHSVPGIVEKRKGNHAKQLIADLDRAYFAAVESAGSTVDLSTITTGLADKLEALIQSVETTKNDYVDGVDRDMIDLTLSVSAYGKIRNFVDTIANPNVDSAAESIEVFHGVRVFSNHRQTADAIAMINGAAGQLVLVDDYDAEKIPLSNDIAIELFYSRGTKAVMPDLIKKATL